MAKKEQTINEIMKKLSEIADKLESGDVDIETSLKLYEQAMNLAAECSEKLGSAKQKISELSFTGINTDE